GDQLVGALALALEVRPVTSRALLFGPGLGLEGCVGCFEWGDNVGDGPPTSRGRRGKGLVPDLFEVDRGQGLAIVTVRARQAMALDDGASRIGPVSTLLYAMAGGRAPSPRQLSA